MHGDMELFPPPAAIRQKTWGDAADRWYCDGYHKSHGTRVDERFVLLSLSRKWSELVLSQIDETAISSILKDVASTGVSARRVNRYAEIIRAVLRASVRWGWLARIPEIRLARRPPRRVRFLTVNEAAQLLAELPEHLRAVAAFSLETGLRKSNVLGLTWGQVDLSIPAAWIHADQAKAKRAIPVPLTPTAVAVLESQRGRHSTWCFTYKGSRISQCNTAAWHKALRRAGISDFRWHDLRHTWASWHAQHGTPLHVLQELGGWETAQMVKVYAHLSTSHLRQYVLDFHERKQRLTARPAQKVTEKKNGAP